jgi:hypothetical protein
MLRAKMGISVREGEDGKVEGRKGKEEGRKVRKVWKERGEMRKVDVHTLYGDDSTTVHRRSDFAKVDGADNGGDSNSASHDHSSDDELRQRVGNADQDATNDEEDVADGKDSLATDSGVGKSVSEGKGNKE